MYERHRKCGLPFGSIGDENMDNECVLKLLNLHFNKIEFIKQGDGGTTAPDIDVTADYYQRENEAIHKVIITANIKKENDYSILLVLEGIFSLESASDLDDDTKKQLITRNTVAIMMPYVRSEISIITAQPDIECLVLPPINVNSMQEIGEK